MERRIMTVNGQELDYVLAEDYVKEMVAMDTVYYHDEVDKYKFGVVRLNTLDSCNSPLGCEGPSMWMLRPDSEFFRPCFDNA